MLPERVVQHPKVVFDFQGHVDKLTKSVQKLSLKQSKVCSQFDAQTVCELIRSNNGNVEKLSDKSKEVIREIGSSLKSLDLTPAHSKEITPLTGRLEGFLFYFPKLLKLHLPEANLHDTDLCLIGKYTQMRELGLSCNPITDVGIAHLQQLSHLNYLNVSYCPKLTEKSFELIGKTCGKLQQLYLHQSKDSPKEGFAKKVIPHLQSLKELSSIGMNYCSVEYDEMEMLCRGHSKLGQLVALGHMFHFEKVLSSLKFLSTLQFLWIDLQEGEKSVCNGVLKKFLQYCPHFHTLFIAGGTRFLQFNDCGLRRMGDVRSQVLKNESILIGK